MALELNKAGNAITIYLDEVFGDIEWSSLGFPNMIQSEVQKTDSSALSLSFLVLKIMAIRLDSIGKDFGEFQRELIERLKPAEIRSNANELLPRRQVS